MIVNNINSTKATILTKILFSFTKAISCSFLCYMSFADTRVVWQTLGRPSELRGPPLAQQMALVPVLRLETPLSNSKRFYQHYLGKYRTCFPVATKAAAAAAAPTRSATASGEAMLEASSRAGRQSAGALIRVRQLKPRPQREPQLRELAMANSYLMLRTPTNTLMFNDLSSDWQRSYSRRELPAEHTEKTDDGAELRIDGFEVRGRRIQKSEAVGAQVGREYTTYSALFRRLAAQRSQRRASSPRAEHNSGSDDVAVDVRESDPEHLEVCLMSSTNAQVQRAQRRSERSHAKRLAHTHSHTAYGNCCQFAFTCACARERALRERLRPGTVSARSGRPARVYVDPISGTTADSIV